MGTWIGWVTLYTDANPHAWGAYARADGRLPRQGVDVRIERAGRFEGRIDTTAAEARAVIEGCRAVRAYWPTVEGIGVRSDSQAAIRLLRWNAQPHRRADLAALQLELAEVLGPVRHRLEWVRGHRPPSSDIRAWLNNRVDRLAAAARG